MKSERATDENRVLLGYPEDALHIDEFLKIAPACARRSLRLRVALCFDGSPS